MKQTKDYPEKNRGAIAFMAGHSVAANLLMVVLLVGGFLYARSIKQEVFPEISLDAVNVSVPYPGASPEEVEQGIILAIEEGIRGLDGIDEVISSASEGMGTVTATLLLGENPQKIAQDIQSAVDRITTIPEDAEKPQIQELAIKNQVISLMLFGDQKETVLREVAENLRDRLLHDPDITQVELSGIKPIEISIEIPQARLREFNITLEQVAALLRNMAIELPGGGVKTKGGEILVRMTDRRNFGKEFAMIPIITKPDGTILHLEDIAIIKDGFAETDTESLYNGKPSIKIDVYRVGDQTPIQISDIVHKYVEEFNEILPADLQVATWGDRAEVFRERLNLLLRNAALGLVLVLILLSLFLEARLAFWVTMGIPISFLGAFLILPLMGVSINMISLFAFIIALGIVVDDAIVVGENIYDYHQRGMSFGKAAVKGARDVSLPVGFSILTNVVAFMPLFFVPGTSGKIFKVIPAVVVVVFLLSWLESILILPNHLAHAKNPRDSGITGWAHHRQQAFSKWFMHIIKDRFGPLLRFTLGHRYTTISISIMILLMVLGLVASRRLGMTLFPKVTADEAVVTAILPYGSPIEKSKQVRDLLMQAGVAVAEQVGYDEQVRGMYASIGGGASETGGPGGSGGGSLGSHVVEVMVFLAPPDKRPIDTDDYVKAWREKVGRIPGLESLVFQSDAGGPGSGAAITIELNHSDLDVLEEASADLASSLSEFAQVEDVNDGFAPGKQQLDFQILPEGQSLGLTSRSVARQIRDAFYGSEVLRQQRGRNELKVYVRLPKEERVAEYNIEELILRTPTGQEVLLREVVNIKRGRAYTVINRREGRRIVNVTANCDPPKDANIILAEVKQTVLPKLTHKYPGLQYGFEGKTADIAKSMKSLMVGFGFAMMMIYALLAIPFRSYVQPLIVMVSIPFGIVGAVLGHLLMGYSLSIMSMLGIVALSGVVVNDSLILIDYANRLMRTEGKSPYDAIEEAGIRRFRPIMLTTLTTFGGLAPMILEKSTQARFLIPMAISLGFGILFATFITLLLVPSLYLIIDDASRLRARISSSWKRWTLQEYNR